MSDGRLWMATLWEDPEGVRSLVFAFAALAHEVDAEAVLLSLVEEGLLVPELSCDIECPVCEKWAGLYGGDPLWVIEVLLSDRAKKWAEPGFTVRESSAYRVH